jgi:hypothetical protein
VFKLLSHQILLVRIFCFLSYNRGICSQIQSCENLLCLVVMEAALDWFERRVAQCHTLLNIRYLLNVGFSSVFQNFVY